MGEPVQQRPGEPFRAEDLGPFVLGRSSMPAASRVCTMVWSIGSSCCTSLASWVTPTATMMLLTHHRLGIVTLHVPLPGLHDAAAEVSGPDSLTSALTPGVLALIGRELIRRSEVVFLIDTTAGKLRLLPAEGHDVAGDSTPDSWEYRLTLGGPSRTITYDYVPAASVLHFRYAVDPSTPWRGNGPVQVAALAGKLSAATAATLGDESSGPVGRLLGIPVDSTDATVEGLKTDIANLRGATFRAGLEVFKVWSMVEWPLPMPLR